MRYAERLSTLVFLVTFLSSCTAALMVADQDDDINIIDVGTSRESIEKKIGNPVETKYLESGELYYVYKVRADEEMARNTISDRLSFATMWIIYDVYYLFIPEILAAPTTVPALVTGKKIGKLREISVLYDSQNRVIAMELGGELQHGAETLYENTRSAAMCGNAHAADLLGRKYELGHGVQSNDLEAYIWYGIAQINAFNSKDRRFSDQNRNDIQKRLTPVQVIEAEKTIARWKPKECVNSGKDNIRQSLGTSNPIEGEDHKTIEGTGQNHKTKDDAFIVEVETGSKRHIPVSKAEVKRTIIFTNVLDARRQKYRIGERLAAFDVSMGNVYFYRPVPDFVEEMVTTDLQAAGYLVVKSGLGMPLIVTIKRFSATTEPTLLYWDIVANIELSVVFGDLTKSFSCQKSDRTYVWPTEYLFSVVVDGCLIDLRKKIRDDPIWQRPQPAS